MKKHRRKSILSCILLEKPRITLLVQLVVIAFKHVVKSLGFPKCERFRGIWYSVKQIILFISYIAKMAFFRFLVFILLVEVLTKVLGRGFDQGFGHGFGQGFGQGFHQGFG